MGNLIGGLSVYASWARDVSYAEVEEALRSAGSTAGYTIERDAAGGETKVMFALNIPVESITAEGVPVLDALETLRRAAAAVERLDSN